MLLESGSVLDMVKMKIRSPVRWRYFVLCVHSLESTSLKIGESTKIGASIGFCYPEAADILFQQKPFHARLYDGWQLPSGAHEDEKS